jgi:hypothetical protein
MKLHSGDMYIVSPDDTTVTGNKDLLYMLTRMSSYGKFKVVVLNTPDDWWTSAFWDTFRKAHVVGMSLHTYASHGMVSSRSFTRADFRAQFYIVGAQHKKIGSLTVAVGNAVNKCSKTT